ncbi:hypothetical protein BH23GEM9_BH23GEM9_36510 [soil metagenome]
MTIRDVAMTIRATGCAALAPLLLGGCLEFGDPMIPDRDAPALLIANMRVFDVGRFQVDGTLTPGRETTGFLRVVQDPRIRAGDVVVEPDEVSSAGVRIYDSDFVIDRNGTAGPFVLVPPDIRGVGPLPVLRWHGLRRAGPDTLSLAPGADIVLRLDTIPEASMPAQRMRQWFVEVRGSGTTFRISADGAPLAALRIPAEWIATSAGDRADVSLIYFQSTQLRDAGNTYIANVVLDVRLNWVVFFEQQT